MQDAWRAYLDLALGLTETSRKKATKVARKLVGRGNATAEQLQSVAEELVSTSLANREALSRLVRFELERALSKVGLATAEEVGALTTRVKELEQELEEAKNGRGRGTTPAPVTPLRPAADTPAPLARKAVAKKAVAKKTVAKKVAGPVQPAAQLVPEVAEVVAAAAGDTAPRPAPAKKATPVAQKAAPQKTAPQKTAAAKAVAKQAPAKQAPVKNAPAKKAVAKKTSAPVTGQA